MVQLANRANVPSQPVLLSLRVKKAQFNFDLFWQGRDLGFGHKERGQLQKIRKNFVLIGGVLQVLEAARSPGTDL